MNYKSRMLLILLASLVTAFFNDIFITLTNRLIPILMHFSSYRMGIILALSASMLIAVASGMPILLLKKVRGIPHVFGITLFATAEAFWLSYLFIPLAVPLLGWWVILPLKIALIIAMYVAGDALFNIWHTRLRYKIALCLAVITGTALLSQIALRAFLT